MMEVLIVIICGTLIATAWLLISKFRSTRDPGFLWLGLGLIIWPLLSGVLAYGERILVERITAGESLQLFPFSMVSQG